MSSTQCIITAPDLFALDEDGYSHALRERVDISRSEDLRMAVEGCPAGAIRITRL
jgi:ferredoxin